MSDVLKKFPAPDKRAYTIKIIPHQGETVRSFSMPIKLVKYAAGTLAVGALLFVGAFGYAAYGSLTMSSRLAENAQLREVNNTQQAQISDLAKKANALQEQMNDLNRLEMELQQVSGALPAPPPQEAPISFDGQGGPYTKPNLSNIHASLGNLEQRIAESRQRIAVIQEAIEKQQEYIAYQQAVNAVTPSIWPTHGDVSSPYGLRWGGSDFHPGVDIANDYGTPILATADGVVTAAGWDSGGYGNKVDLDHGYGIETRYAHAQSVIVSAGDRVSKGQVIAYMGNTGYSTGPHLHYEVTINGEPVDPFGYMH